MLNINERKLYLDLGFPSSVDICLLNAIMISFQTFKTVMDLVNFFKKHTLILAAGGDGQTRLKHSCPPI